MSTIRPSEQMRALGIVQRGAPVLARPARPFRFPAERDEAEQVVAKLAVATEHLRRVHPFAKGLGITAPQLDIGRAAAVVQPADSNAAPIVLFNPRITAAVGEDEQYEGCLSFFDVRGLVSRPLRITVEATALDGSTATTVYERGTARLVHHEIDHLEGLLYSARMRTGVGLVPVEEYRQSGLDWAYEE